MSDGSSPRKKPKCGPSSTGTSCADASAENDVAENFLKCVASTSKPHVFLTGGAGTGKSTLIATMCKNIRNNRPVVKAAPTNIAARNISGHTLASLYSNAKWKRSPPTWETDAVLIIDEVSMVSAEDLDLYSESASALLVNDKPFGGMQVVFVGDLFQLSPFNEDKKGDKPKYFFSSEVYPKLKARMFNLTKIYRQIEDTSFADILNRFRWGIVSEEDINSLVNSGPDSPDQSSQNNNNIVSLTCSRKQRRDINAAHVGSIPGGEGREYHIKFKGKKSDDSSTILLKIGSRVMTKENGVSYCKGIQGFVTNLGAERITIEVWPKDSDSGGFITVDGQQNDDDDNDQKLYFPVELAHAITIHSCQGLTLEHVRVDFGDKGCFAAGQGYTALSRAKSSSKLSVAGVYSSDIKAHPDVVRFYMDRVVAPYCNKTFSSLRLIAGFTGMPIVLENVLVFVMKKCFEKQNSTILYVICDSNAEDNDADKHNRMFFQCHVLLRATKYCAEGALVKLNGEFILNCCELVDKTKPPYKYLAKPYKQNIRWQLEPTSESSFTIISSPNQTCTPFDELQLFDSHTLANFETPIPQRADTLAFQRVEWCIYGDEQVFRDVNGNMRGVVCWPKQSSVPFKTGYAYALSKVQIRYNDHESGSPIIYTRGKSSYVDLREVTEEEGDEMKAAAPPPFLSAEFSQRGILQQPLLAASDVSLYIAPTCLQQTTPDDPTSQDWFKHIEAHFLNMFKTFVTNKEMLKQSDVGLEKLETLICKFFIAPELPLGLGMSTTSQGRGVGQAQAMKAARHVIPFFTKFQRHIEEKNTTSALLALLSMEILSEGFGPDRISDLLAFILLPHLVKFTSDAISSMRLDNTQTKEFQSYEDFFDELKGDGHLFEKMELKAVYGFPDPEPFTVFVKNEKLQLFVPESIVDQEKVTAYFNPKHFDASFQSAYVLRENLNAALHTTFATNYMSYQAHVNKVDLDELFKAKTFRIDLLVYTSFDLSDAIGLVLQDICKESSPPITVDGMMRGQLHDRCVVLATNGKTDDIKLSVHTQVIAVQQVFHKTADFIQIVQGTLLTKKTPHEVLYSSWPQSLWKFLVTEMGAAVQGATFRQDGHVFVPQSAGVHDLDNAAKLVSTNTVENLLLGSTVSLKSFRKLTSKHICKPLVLGFVASQGREIAVLHPIISCMTKMKPRENPDYCAITTWNVKCKPTADAVTSHLKKILQNPQSIIVALQEQCPFKTSETIQNLAGLDHWLSVPGCSGNNAILFDSRHVKFLDSAKPVNTLKGLKFQHECCVARFQIATFRVLVVNVHLNQKQPLTGPKPAEVELERLEDVLTTKFDKEQVILLGDFNLLPSTVQGIMKGRILFLVSNGDRTATASDSCHDNFGYSAGLKPLFVRKEIACGLSVSKFADASDHAPVLCIFNIDRSKTDQTDKDGLLKRYHELNPTNSDTCLRRCRLLKGMAATQNKSHAHVALHNSKVYIVIKDVPKQRYYKGKLTEKDSILDLDQANITLNRDGELRYPPNPKNQNLDTVKLSNKEDITVLLDWKVFKEPKIVMKATTKNVAANLAGKKK